MAFMLTRIRVQDYETWKTQMFDHDRPGVRSEASGYRILRGVEDPNEVFIQLEFESPEQAAQAREKLIAAGVLERFGDRTGPTVAQLAEAVTL